MDGSKTKTYTFSDLSNLVRSKDIVHLGANASIGTAFSILYENQQQPYAVSFDVEEIFNVKDSDLVHLDGIPYMPVYLSKNEDVVSDITCSRPYRLFTGETRFSYETEYETKGGIVPNCAFVHHPLPKILVDVREVKSFTFTSRRYLLNFDLRTSIAGSMVILTPNFFCGAIGGKMYPYSKFHEYISSADKVKLNYPGMSYGCLASRGDLFFEITDLSKVLRSKHIVNVKADNFNEAWSILYNNRFYGVSYNTEKLYDIKDLPITHQDGKRYAEIVFAIKDGFITEIVCSRPNHLSIMNTNFNITNEHLDWSFKTEGGIVPAVYITGARMRLLVELDNTETFTVKMKKILLNLTSETFDVLGDSRVIFTPNFLWHCSGCHPYSVLHNILSPAYSTVSFNVEISTLIDKIDQTFLHRKETEEKELTV